MLKEIKQVGEDLGITVIITSSKEKIETQLNRIVMREVMPVMLISWDIKIKLEFNSSGGFKNPTTTPKILLLDKAEDTSKASQEKTADDMALLFQSFLLNLNNYMTANSNAFGQSLTNIKFQFVPNYGAGKHSGIIGDFDLLLPTPGFVPTNRPVKPIICPI
jgi:hypothetical protein